MAKARWRRPTKQDVRYSVTWAALMGLAFGLSQWLFDASIWWTLGIACALNIIVLTTTTWLDD